MTVKSKHDNPLSSDGQGVPAEQSFDVPIRLEIGVNKKKTHYLNLGNYRNWQFQVSNQMKKTFKIKIAETVRALKPVSGPVRITYSIFYPTRRLFDVDNIGSVVCKFTLDALVEFDVLEDDNYKFVPEINFEFGGVDKENPRCVVKIEEIPDD